MALLIGTDEAGYGPPLGPLVIGMTVWEVPDAYLGRDLYDSVANVIARDVIGRGNGDSGDGRLRMTDSKRLYSSSGSLAPLESSVLAAAYACQLQPRDWSQLWSQLAPTGWPRLNGLPWYMECPAAVPLRSDAQQIQQHGRRLRDGLATTGIRLRGMRADVLPACEFNRRCHQSGSKGQVLSAATLELVRWAYQRAQGAACHIVCDKHGSRTRYQPLLLAHLTDELTVAVSESRAESCYRWAGGHQISFRAGGESDLPTALASMLAKYLREMAMWSWNAYWCRRDARLRPTAGYWQDAARFYREIRPLVKRMGLKRNQLWRSR